MIATIIVLVVLVVGIDALRSRVKLNLRTRAAHAVRPKSHEIIHRSPGWRALDEIQRESEAAGVIDDENPFARMRSTRRGVGR